MKQTKTKLIKIGNSQGIRIPKPLIEQFHLYYEVIMVVKDDHIELHPGKQARTGWAEAFQRMAKTGDDKLLDQPTPTKWDDEEWEW